MTQKNARKVEVRDIRRRTPEELDWQHKVARKSRSFKVYVILGVLAAIILLVSIVVGVSIGWTG